MEYCSSEAVFLGAIKHQERNSVYRFFTRTHGVLPFYVRNSNKQRSAYMNSKIMCAFQLEYIFKEGRNIQAYSEAQVHPDFLPEVHPIRAAILFFVCDVLRQTLPEAVAETDKYDMVRSFTEWVRGIELHELKVAPIIFMIKYAESLGITPDLTHHDLHLLGIPQNREIRVLIDKTSQMDKKTRECVLQDLFLHFFLHLDGFKEPKSFTVLKELFT